MQFTLYTVAAAAAAFAGLSTAAPSLETRAATGSQQIKWDPVYDNGQQSMNTVACSDGSNGLSKQWPTFGAVPYQSQGTGGWGVAASPDVGSWNSPSCGTCYKISYKGKNAWVIAVDHSAGGFNVGQGVMNYLTGGRAVEFGKIQADVSVMACPSYWRRQ